MIAAGVVFSYVARPITAGSELVSILKSAPRSVIALADEFDEVTIAAALIESVPTPSSPVPAAVRSAPSARVPCRY